MGILNRRNALIGWTVWNLVKRAAAMRARGVRGAVPSGRRKRGPRRVRIAALVGGVAATLGALWLFGRGGDGPPDE